MNILMLHFIYWGIVSHLNPELANLASIAQPACSSDPLLCLPCWSYRWATTSAWHFHGCWGSEFGSSVASTFIYWTISSALNWGLRRTLYSHTLKGVCCPQSTSFPALATETWHILPLKKIIFKLENQDPSQNSAILTQVFWEVRVLCHCLIMGSVFLKCQCWFALHVYRDWAIEDFPLCLYQ